MKSDRRGEHCSPAIQIRSIEWNSPEYKVSLVLRDEILRRPLGLSLFDEDLSAEKDDILVCALLPDGKLIGTLALTVREEHTVQMRQVAVEENFQGQGVGSALVRFAEDYAKVHGFDLMILHARARAPAVGFYEKLGYRVTGGFFTEVGIEHLPMGKSCNH